MELYVLRSAETGLYLHYSVDGFLRNQRDANGHEAIAARDYYLPSRRATTWTSNIDDAMTVISGSGYERGQFYFDAIVTQARFYFPGVDPVERAEDRKCVNAHDRCFGGAGGPCPLCE